MSDHVLVVQTPDRVQLRTSTGENLDTEPVDPSTLFPGGGAAGIGAAASFVYRPGGVAAPGVFNSATALKAALLTVDPASDKVVVVDTSIAAAHLTAAQSPWPLDNVTFESATGANQLTLDAGCTFTPGTQTLRVRNMVLAVDAGSGAPIWTPTPGSFLELQEAVIVNPSPAALVHVNGPGGIFAAVLRASSIASGILAEIMPTGGAQCISLDGSTVNATSFHSVLGAGGVLAVSYDPSSARSTSPTQDNANLVVTYLPLSAAPGQNGWELLWYAATDVYWDPAGSVGGSDSNSGTVVGSPVLTFAEIVRRYGSNSPTLPYGQSLTIHVLSAQPPGIDPVFFEPRVSGGGQAILDGRAAWVPAGAPYALGALSGGFGYAAGVPSAGGVQMTQAAPPGYVAAGQVLNNTTRSSYALADTATTLSQPQTMASLTTTTALPNPVIDNDWVAGDNIIPFITPAVNLKRWDAIGGDVTAGGQPCASWVIGVNIVDPGGAAGSEYGMMCHAANNVLSLCRVDTRCNFSGSRGRSSNGSGPVAMACYFAGLTRQMSAQVSLYGCVHKAGFNNEAGQAFFGNNNVLHGGVNVQASNVNVLASGMFADGAWTVAGGMVIVGSGAAGIAWGSYSVTVYPAGTWLNRSGSTFVLKGLLTNGALNLGAAGTGSSFTPGTGLWASAIALTPAAIDAANGLQDPATGARFCNFN